MKFILDFGYHQHLWTSSIRHIINTDYSVIQRETEVSNLPGVYAMSIGKQLPREPAALVGLLGIRRPEI